MLLTRSTIGVFSNQVAIRRTSKVFEPIPDFSQSLIYEFQEDPIKTEEVMSITRAYHCR